MNFIVFHNTMRTAEVALLNVSDKTSKSYKLSNIIPYNVKHYL